MSLLHPLKKSMIAIAALTMGAIGFVPIAHSTGSHEILMRGAMQTRFYKKDTSSGPFGGYGNVSCYYIGGGVHAKRTTWRLEAHIYTTDGQTGLKPNSIIDGFRFTAETWASPGYNPPFTRLDYNPRWSKVAGGSNITPVGWDKHNAGFAFVQPEAYMTHRLYENKRLVRVIQTGLSPVFAAPKFQIFDGIAFTKAGSRPIYFFDSGPVLPKTGNFELFNRSVATIIKCGGAP